MKPDSLKPLGCRGMTLVEVLVVAAILGFVIMAVMSLFIPAVKSTAVQTELTDVQSNLRLGINRMTDDLLTAGFLMGSGQPIINQDATTFTIQTRAVGNSFARVASASASDLVLTDADMIDSFPAGSKIRFFDAVMATEIGTDPRTVNATDKSASTLTIAEAITDIVPETVIVRVKDGAPTTQTIRYALEDGALVRIVNGDKQLLARGITAVNFGYETTPSGKVHKIDITLTGETQDRGNDVLSETKSRSLQSSVTLRNVF